METADYTFIADVHLGKLARLLRMLGFDTLYNNSLTNTELIAIAVQQNRMLLTRNASIDKHHSSLHSFFIMHNAPEVQLQQVLQHFHLSHQLYPFSRCLVCNGMVNAVPKEVIVSQLPENTSKYCHEFWQCVNCSRIYWKGPHYNRMINFVNDMKQEAG